MEKEEIIRSFVQKRALYRKISVVVLMALLIFAAVMRYYTASGILIDSQRYMATIAVFTVVWIGLCYYVGTVLSTCPICHKIIPTAKVSRHSSSGKKKIGNGPLPENCPYCGTNFSKYGNIK